MLSGYTATLLLYLEAEVVLKALQIPGVMTLTSYFVIHSQTGSICEDFINIDK